LTVTYSVDANHRVADEDIVIETTIKTKEKLDPVVSMSSVTGVYDGKTDVLSISFTPLLSSNPDAVSFSSLIYTLYTADNVATKYTGSFEFGSEVTLTGIAPDTDYYVVLSYVIDKNEAETYKKAYTSDSFHTTKVYGLTLTDIDYVTSSEDITIHASDSIMTLSTIQYFRMILTADALATGYEITNFEDYMNKFDMISLWAQGCGIDDGCIIENNDNAVILIKENQIYLYLPLETSNADGITKDQMQYADKYFYRDDTSFSSIYWERRDNHHCNYLLNLVYKANDLEYVLYNGMYAMYTTSNILK